MDQTGLKYGNIYYQEIAFEIFELCTEIQNKWRQPLHSMPSNWVEIARSCVFGLKKGAEKGDPPHPLTLQILFFSSGQQVVGFESTQPPRRRKIPRFNSHL